MTHARRITLILFCLLISLALVACGAQPTAAPASSDEPPSSAETLRPAEQPRPTEEARPTEQQPPPSTEGAQPTAGGAVAVPDVAEAYEYARNLPSYHFEGTYWGQEGGGTPGYLRMIQDVDAQGNMRLRAFDQEDGEAVLDMYYVDQHLYVGGPGGRYVDMGVQEAEQAAAFYQMYQVPFTVVLLGATDLEPMGKEDVNGLAATKYRASFEEWARSYIQAEHDVTYTAEGYLWISDEYRAIVKSSVQAVVTENGKTVTFGAESEISQVGQVEPITAP